VAILGVPVDIHAAPTVAGLAVIKVTKAISTIIVILKTMAMGRLTIFVPICKPSLRFTTAVGS
jgi:hypothetical protein